MKQSCGTCRYAKYFSPLRKMAVCTFKVDISELKLPSCIQVTPSLKSLLECRRHLVSRNTGADCPTWKAEE